MKLSFLGTGGAFAPTHTNAWFRVPAVTGKAKPRDGEQAATADRAVTDLYFLDLSMLNIFAARALVTDETGEVTVLLTHMHDDHCGGIGLFAEWLYYIRNRKLRIIADRALRTDIDEYMRIIGVLPQMYDVRTPEELPAGQGRVVQRSIPTRHTPSLEGKCFGFLLEIGGTRVVYTGDTATLEPFLPYLEPGTELYMEMSALHGGVHLLWSEQKELVLRISRTCDVCLMHLDDVESLRRETAGTGITLAAVSGTTPDNGTAAYR